MSRPLQKKARKQVDDDPSVKKQRIINMETYNIWYDRHMNHDRPIRIHATTRCVIQKDAGRTKGDEKPTAFICLYFARGCCSLGHECHFLHRLPDDEYEKRITLIHDIFGRERHGTDRDDMGGVGTFSRDNRTLYIGNLRIVKDIEAVMQRHFSEWGEIEAIRVLHLKNCGFVRYKLRGSAEFAKEAMSDQSLDHNEMLNVRWAVEDPNPKAKKRIIEENEAKFKEAYERLMPGSTEYERWQAAGGLYTEDGQPLIPQQEHYHQPGQDLDPNDPDYKRKLHEAWQDYYDQQIALSIQQECGEVVNEDGAYVTNTPAIQQTSPQTTATHENVSQMNEQYDAEAYAAYYQQYYQYYQYCQQYETSLSAPNLPVDYQPETKEEQESSPMASSSLTGDPLPTSNSHIVHENESTSLTEDEHPTPIENEKQNSKTFIPSPEDKQEQVTESIVHGTQQDADGKNEIGEAA